MAARLNPKQDNRARSAIQTTQLIKRLQQFALGAKGDQGETVVMEAQQVRAVEILLRKTLPDLSSVTLGGDADNPLHVITKIQRVIVDPDVSDA